MKKPESLKFTVTVNSDFSLSLGDIQLENFYTRVMGEDALYPEDQAQAEEMAANLRTPEKQACLAQLKQAVEGLRK